MRRPSASYFIVVFVAILVALGVVILYSTSGVLSETHPHLYLKRQLVWIALGVVAMLIMSQVDYRIWRTLAVPMALLSVILLAMAIMPGVGILIDGSRRWLRFGPINFQPTELAKLSSVVILAWWMARVQRQAKEFRKGMLVPLAFLMVFTSLIIVEPDFGATLLVGSVGMAILFVAGTRVGYLILAGMAGAGGIALLISQDKERRDRFLAFLNPEEYALTDGYQLIQARYALVTGGTTGVGLGNSMQKREYLPKAHNDFIFAIIGEELGFRVTLLVVILYLGIFLCGLYIANRTEDRFGKLLAFGITMLITVQAAVNIGVVTGVLPTKGITLPFISYGGSSMVMTLLMVGILLNIAMNLPERASEQDGKFIKDSARQV